MTGRTGLRRWLGALCALALVSGMSPPAGANPAGRAAPEPPRQEDLGPPPDDHAPPDDDAPADEDGPDSGAGPAAGPGQWFLDDYGIADLWTHSTGEGVTVSVIDSGVEDAHENLTGQVRAGRDFSGSGADGTTPIGPAETIHHGTAVAGVIAGTGAGAGPTGVAPDAEILAASMWLGSGAPEAAPRSRDQAAEAIRWSVDNGAQVINMSLGWDDPSWPESWDDAFAYAYSKDVVIVACVGNSSQGAAQAWSPSTVPGVVGVGGLSQDGSVRIPSTAPGIAVDLMGPAEEIPVPFHSGGYAQAGGCSFAAPVVSGIVALLRGAQPDLSADQVIAKLEATAAEVPGHAGRSTTEAPDPVIGWGRVQPLAAYESDVPSVVSSAAAELADWVEMHRRAPAPEETSASGQVRAPESAAPGEAASVQVGRFAVIGPVVLGAGVLASAALLALGLLRARRAADNGSSPR